MDPFTLDRYFTALVDGEALMPKEASAVADGPATDARVDALNAASNAGFVLAHGRVSSWVKPFGDPWMLGEWLGCLRGLSLRFPETRFAIALDGVPFAALFGGIFDNEEIDAHEAWTARFPPLALHGTFTSARVTYTSAGAEVSAVADLASGELGTILRAVDAVNESLPCEVVLDGETQWRRVLRDTFERFYYALFISVGFRGAAQKSDVQRAERLPPPPLNDVRHVLGNERIAFWGVDDDTASLRAPVLLGEVRSGSLVSQTELALGRICTTYFLHKRDGTVLTGPQLYNVSAVALDSAGSRLFATAHIDGEPILVEISLPDFEVRERHVYGANESEPKALTVLEARVYALTSLHATTEVTLLDHAWGFLPIATLPGIVDSQVFVEGDVMELITVEREAPQQSYMHRVELRDGTVRTVYAPSAGRLLSWTRAGAWSALAVRGAETVALFRSFNPAGHFTVPPERTLRSIGISPTGALAATTDKDGEDPRLHVQRGSAHAEQALPDFYDIRRWLP